MNTLFLCKLQGFVAYAYHIDACFQMTNLNSCYAIGNRSFCHLLAVKSIDKCFGCITTARNLHL